MKQDGADSPKVKDPNFILGQTYVSSDKRSRKCRKAYKACGETLQSCYLNKHMGFDKIK